MGGFQVLQHQTPVTQMTWLALILLQLPSRLQKCVSSTQDKWPQKWLYPWVSLLILQQPIRAKLFWWLLNLSFKIGRPHYSCFSATMTSLFGYLFTPVCIPSFFFLFSFFFKLTKKRKSVHKYKIAIKKAIYHCFQPNKYLMLWVIIRFNYSQSEKDVRRWLYVQCQRINREWINFSIIFHILFEQLEK